MSEVNRPDFDTLKDNYRTGPQQHHGNGNDIARSCNIRISNSCAIRMSEALYRTNDKWKEVFQNSAVLVCREGMVRGAQGLGRVLRDNWGVRDLGWKGKNLNGNAPTAINGKQGVVCYMNIPGYTGEGHVDLWDKNGPVGSEYWGAETIWFWKL